MKDPDQSSLYEYFRFKGNGRTWRIERYAGHDTAEVCVLGRLQSAEVSSWVPRATMTGLNDVPALRSRGAVPLAELYELCHLFGLATALQSEKLAEVNV